MKKRFEFVKAENIADKTQEIRNELTERALKKVFDEQTICPLLVGIFGRCEIDQDLTQRYIYDGKLLVESEVIIGDGVVTIKTTEQRG